MSKSLTIELLKELIADDGVIKLKPVAVGIRDLPDEERKAYKARKQAERRAKLKERVDRGSVKFDVATAREALADAALMLLASGADGSVAIERYLEKVFHDQAGAPLTIKAKARAGLLKPKLLHIAAKAS
ncbi:hypothetical protein [Neorhizobium tomejilense]|uniref:hypothetical protein n=1 Tax=Neorhizobium tomejilense TaxID=2093828 RepID=UPI003ECD5BF8